MTNMYKLMRDLETFSNLRSGALDKLISS